MLGEEPSHLPLAIWKQPTHKSERPWCTTKNGTGGKWHLICNKISPYYFGGARSKGFAMLRNVSKLQFFDKIGQAKSVGFRLYSAIWRSENRISSRYLEITSISLIYSLTFSKKKELLFWLSGVWTDSPVWPVRSEETLSWEISRLRYCDPR